MQGAAEMEGGAACGHGVPASAASRRGKAVLDSTQDTKTAGRELAMRSCLLRHPSECLPDIVQVQGIEGGSQKQSMAGVQAGPGRLVGGGVQNGACWQEALSCLVLGVCWGCPIECPCLG